MPKVSIIIPTYNREKFIAKCIESIQAQTLKDWELIIVNDCSTDKTVKIAESYAQKDKRIQIYHNKKNLKLPATLNVGFRHARGKYWTWTPDDDIFMPTALEVMVKALDNNPDVALVYTDMTLINENGESIGLSRRLPPEYLIAEDVVAGCRMYRADVAKKMGEYREDLFLVEDYEYWLRIGVKHKLMHIPQNLYKFCAHGGSLTSTYRQQVAKRDAKLRADYAQHYPPLNGRQRSIVHLNLWVRNKMKIHNLILGFINAPFFFTKVFLQRFGLKLRKHF